MHVLIDINHPAHAHFFRHPIALLAGRGHDVTVTSRAKEMALPLLDELGIPHLPLSNQPKRSGILGLARELFGRDLALYRQVCRRHPDIMAAIGGTFIAHVGAMAGVHSLVFYDTECARLQNLITYPLASCVFVPRCYQGWLPPRHRRYAGYHELSYLHPTRFVPSRDVAIANGLDPKRDNFFLRCVSWQANHDLGEKGWSVPLLSRLVDHLSRIGRVLISSETPLPAPLRHHAYPGAIGAVHHVLAHCRLFVGESATMASECAVLGTPAIYAARTGRGYTDEQEARYALVRNVRNLKWDALSQAVDEMLAVPHEQWPERRGRLLAESIDVARYVADAIEQYPDLPPSMSD